MQGGVADVVLAVCAALALGPVDVRGRSDVAGARQGAQRWEAPSLRRGRDPARVRLLAVHRGGHHFWRVGPALGPLHPAPW